MEMTTVKSTHVACLSAVATAIEGRCAGIAPVCHVDTSPGFFGDPSSRMVAYDLNFPRLLKLGQRVEGKLIIRSPS